MANERIVQQVRGIFAMNHVECRPSSSQESFLVTIPGRSSAIFIDFHDWEGKTVIALIAHVLEEVHIEEQQAIELLYRLNALNLSTRFGKFAWDQEQNVIRLEYELLGDELEKEELLVPLLTLAKRADEIDDDFASDLGVGSRAADVIARLQEHT